MTTRRHPRILISGGGTGGHIFPALSIADEVRRRCPGAEILFVGAQGRMEMERVPAAGYDIKGLPVAGFDRKRLWRNFGVLLKLRRSLTLARSIVRDFAPDIAVGVGGYASGPVLKQAQRAGVPTLLQEQNSYAGVTNKLLAAKARAVCTAYPEMERFFPADRITLTGNPVRASLTGCTLTPEEARRRLGFDPERPLVLVTGGSLGARTVNESVIAALSALREHGVQLMWQTGRLYAEECAAHARGLDGVKASAFITDMALAYRAATLVVARAGAGTISELELLGKPAVLIPSPNVAEDHQTCNARALSSRQAAVLLPDAEAPARLGSVITELVADPARLEELGANAAALGRPDATAAIVDTLFALINREDLCRPHNASIS